MEPIYIYLYAVNITGFVIMGIDKYKAQRHKWRINEKVFFSVGLIGGGLGVLLGMYFFHHKTKHLKFKLGIPLIMVLNIAMFGYLLQKL